MHLSLRAGTAALMLGPVLALTPTVATASPTPAPPPPSTLKMAAQAAERPASQGGDGVYSGTIKVSKSAYDTAKRVEKATSPAHTNKSGQIDWNWVEDVFSNKSERNAFGAGWWSRRHDWKQFTHLSSNDKKGIIAWSKSHSGPNPSASPMMTARRAPVACTGYTGTYDEGSGVSKQYYRWLNSCDTTTVIAATKNCVSGEGAIGAVFAVVTGGLAAIPASLAIWGCEAQKGALEDARDDSTLKAVLVILTILHKEKDGRYDVPYLTYPQ